MGNAHYLLFFSKQRVPTAAEFEKLKPAFSGPAVSTPQLIFVDNPKEAASRVELTLDSIIKNHETDVFSKARATLVTLVKNSTTSTEAAIYQRMLGRVTTFLFISTLREMWIYTGG